jgi:hypothetical protein
MISPRRFRPSILLALLAGCGVLLGGCAELPPRPELPAESALPAGQTTRLDQGFSPLEEAHPGQSGFMLLIEGTEAFAVRVRSAAVAERSLDVQTYIWHGDESGVFIVKRLLEAADRGVKATQVRGALGSMLLAIVGVLQKVVEQPQDVVVGDGSLVLRMYYGPELNSDELEKWARRHGVERRFIQPVVRCRTV